MAIGLGRLGDLLFPPLDAAKADLSIKELSCRLNSLLCDEDICQLGTGRVCPTKGGLKVL